MTATDYAEGLARMVFAPDYYDGAWYIVCGRKRRWCRNHATALAWGAYLARHGFVNLYITKVH